MDAVRHAFCLTIVLGRTAGIRYFATNVIYEEVKIKLFLMGVQKFVAFSTHKVPRLTFSKNSASSSTSTVWLPPESETLGTVAAVAADAAAADRSKQVSSPSSSSIADDGGFRQGRY